MGILLTFEINGNPLQKREVAGLLDERGYKWFYPFGDSTAVLPENSVFHDERTTAEAIVDFTTICESIKILTQTAYFSETDPLVSDQTDHLTGCRAW